MRWLMRTPNLMRMAGVINLTAMMKRRATGIPIMVLAFRTISKVEMSALPVNRLDVRSELINWP